MKGHSDPQHARSRTYGSITRTDSPLIPCGYASTHQQTFLTFTHRLPHHHEPAPRLTETLLLNQVQRLSSLVSKSIRLQATRRRGSHVNITCSFAETLVRTHRRASASRYRGGRGSNVLCGLEFINKQRTWGVLIVQ